MEFEGRSKEFEELSKIILDRDRDDRLIKKIEGSTGVSLSGSNGWENWLKIELAGIIKESGYEVKIEYNKIDILVKKKEWEKGWAIELKCVKKARDVEEDAIGYALKPERNNGDLNIGLIFFSHFKSKKSDNNSKSIDGILKNNANVVCYDSKEFNFRGSNDIEINTDFYS